MRIRYEDMQYPAEQVTFDGKLPDNFRIFSVVEKQIREIVEQINVKSNFVRAQSVKNTAGKIVN